MALSMVNQLRCSNLNCGFVVHDRYFSDKTRFAPGICPSCGGVINVVDAFTTRISVTHRLQVDPREAEYRGVVPI